MKVRLDFVTNSSSSSYLMAIAPNKYSTKDKLIEEILKIADLGPSWAKHLDAYINEMKVKDLEAFEFGSHGETMEEVDEIYVDDRVNYLPDQKVYAASVYYYGDESPGLTDLVMQEHFGARLGNVIVHTEGNDC